MNADAMLIEHMMSPKNYGKLAYRNTEGIGKNPQNGEKVVVYMHIKEDEPVPYIDDIGFEAIGCTTTVVAGSMLTEEAKGLSLDGARNLVAATKELLKKLPEEDAACSEMVALAIEAAIDTYEKRKTDVMFPTLTYYVSNSCSVNEKEEENNEKFVD